MTNSTTPLVVAVGAINWDVTLFVESLPAPGQEVTVSEVARVPGGTGANVAVAAARLLPKQSVSFIGALGDDAIAGLQSELLHSEGIRTDAVPTISNAESGQAFILVDANSQNIIASALGANALLTPDHVRQPAARSMLARARNCAITDPPLPVIEEILYITTATDCRVSWDPGVLAAADPAIVVPLARRVDTLLLNEEETADLFGQDDPREIAARLRTDGWRNRIILKQGAQGAVVIDLLRDELTRVPPLPLAELDMVPVSSVGAGDAFHGALAALEAQGHDAADVLLGATAAAGVNVSRPGTRDAPTADELDAVLNAWRALGGAVRSDTIE